jgi:putative glycosyltransferase (TIGR04348 family)
MRIALVTPAGPGMRNGNRHTALRWAAFLRGAGHRVEVSVQWSPDARIEAMLALHARRSYPSIKTFSSDKLLVVALTGTDVYRDIHESAEARASLELAHRLIVLQPRAAQELPARLRRKVRVVVQSSATRLSHEPVKGKFRLCVVGHLRAEKDPMRTLAALAHLPERNVEVVHLGAALDEDLEAEARGGMAREPRYRWLGSVPHARALRWLASSHAMVISSRIEGGANVVCEALRIGVPVLASRIPGNLGLLGTAYPAYFPVEDEQALARLISRAAGETGFYGRLKKELRPLRRMVAPRAEARALLAALYPLQLSDRTTVASP